MLEELAARGSRSDQQLPLDCFFFIISRTVGSEQGCTIAWQSCVSYVRKSECIFFIKHLIDCKLFPENNEIIPARVGPHVRNFVCCSSFFIKN